MASNAAAELSHDGFTVSSNSGTVEDLHRDLGVETVETPDPVETVEPEPVETKIKSRDAAKRIATTTYEREEANRRAEAAQREADDAKAELARLKAEREQPREEPRRTDDEQKRYTDWKAGHDEADPKPSVQSFDDHDAYLDARDEWNERRIDRKQERIAQERQQFERQDAIGRAAANFKSRVDAEAAKDAAFGQMVQSIQIPGDGPLFDVFLDPQTPVEALVRYFHAEPGQLASLIGMRKGQQLAEVHRILGRLEARAEAAPAGSAVREKPTTKAHPPINPVGGSHVAAANDPPGDDATDEEWYAHYGRDGKSKRS